MGEEASVSEAQCHPERSGVYAAGTDRKVTRLTLGDLFTCLVLGLSRGRPKGGQKSADGIVGNRQAELVRHSKAERRSKQIGRAVPLLLKARTREPGPIPQPRVPQETP